RPNVVLEVVAGSDVAAPAVGHVLEQRRPLARASASQRLTSGVIHGDDVVAVDAQTRDGVWLRMLVELGLRLSNVERQVAGVEIVFADNDHRQLLEGREVQRLTKDPRLDGAGPEEDGGDPVFALQHAGQGGTDTGSH